MIQNNQSQFASEDFNKVDQFVKMLESAHIFAKEQLKLKEESILYKRRPPTGQPVEKTLRKFTEFCTPAFLRAAFRSGDPYTVVFQQQIDQTFRKQLRDIL